MKPLSGSLINRYAKAVFAAAEQTGVLAEVRADLLAITDAWRENPEFAMLALNPRLTKAKVRMLLMSLADRVHAQTLTRHFLDLLLEKDRLEVLSGLGLRFEKLWRDHQGEIEVTVKTAIPVGEPLQKAILAHLAERSGRTPQVTWQRDESLLGGIVIHWPDRVFDGSLARKLENLRTDLAQTI